LPCLSSDRRIPTQFQQRVQGQIRDDAADDRATKCSERDDIQLRQW
jgi:hypothetical protein